MKSVLWSVVHSTHHRRSNSAQCALHWRPMRDREQEIENMEIVDSNFEKDLEENIEIIRNFMREYSNIIIKYETLFPNTNNLFGEQNEKLKRVSLKMMEKLQAIKQQKVKIREYEEKENILSKKQNQKQEKENSFLAVYENLKERALLFKQKLEITIDELSDNQIMERLNNMKTLDDNFNKILDLISELKKASPPDHEI